MRRKEKFIVPWLSFAVALAVLVSGCSAPRPSATTPPAGFAVTPAGARSARATPTAPALSPAQLLAEIPTMPPAPTAVQLATVPPATPVPEATATPAPQAVQAATGGVGQAGSLAQSSQSQSSVPMPPGVPEAVPSLDQNKYPAPVPVTPDDNAVFHVAQPVVHFVWTNTPADLMTFGQMSQCQPDSTHFRYTLETTQLVFHSLDNAQPDIVAWMDTGTDYNLNLTTVKPGRYSWWVNIGVICQSYVIGQRNDLPQHKSTLDRTYLGQVSPSSAPRTLTWIP